MSKPIAGRNSRRWLLMLTSLFVLLIIIELWPRLTGSGPKPLDIVTCTDLAAGCAFQLEGREVYVRFMQPPSVLRPFELQVRAPWANAIHARFSMHGMDMGPNRYRLVRSGDVWQAKIILPVCVSGQRDWVLSLKLDDKLADMEFIAGNAS
jgi:hypothetical protein